MTENRRTQSCECVNRNVKKIDRYVTTLPGIEVVVYDAAESAICEDCGAESIRIPNVRGLITVAALIRLLDPRKLSASDIRFLRTTAKWSGRELAKRLQVTQETVSRWENDKMPMGVHAERILRYLIAAEMRPKAPHMRVRLDNFIRMPIRPVSDVNDGPVIELELMKANVLAMEDGADIEAYREASIRAA